MAIKNHSVAIFNKNNFSCELQMNNPTKKLLGGTTGQFLRNTDFYGQLTYGA